jgi:hypothetical protein
MVIGRSGRFDPSLRLSEFQRRMKMFCTDCGAPNKEETTFCIQCGESLSEVQRAKRPAIKRLGEDLLSLKTNLSETLFDFSFGKFVIPRIIKFLYGLTILCAGLMALLLIIIGSYLSTGFGIFLFLFGAPVFFLLTAIYSRAFLEMVVAVLRMADQTADMAKRWKSLDPIQWNIE